MSEDHASPADCSGGISDDVRRAARGSVALGAGQVVARLAQLGFVLAVTRLVVPDEFGRYALATALLVFGGFIGDFGTTRLIVKTVSRYPRTANGILSGTLLASVALGTAGWVGITGVAALMYSTTSTIDVAVAGASLPAAAAATSLMGACDGVGRFGYRTVATTLQTLIATVGGAAAVWLTSDIRAGLAALPVASVGALMSAGYAAHRAGLLRSRLRVDAPLVRWLLRGSVPFALFAGLGAVSGRFDVLFLSVAVDRRAAAEYDVALRAVEALWYFHSLVTGPALFLLSRRIADGDICGTQRAYGEAVRLSYLAGLLVTSIIVGLHRPIAEVLGGDEYPRTATALALIGFGTWLSFVALAQGALLLASDHLRLGLRVAAAITAGTVALDAVLIPLFGVVGASLASVAAAAMTVIGFAWFARRAEGLRTPLPPWGSITAAVITTAAAWRMSDQFVLAGVLATLTFGGILLLTGAIEKDDLGRLRRALRRA